MKKKLLSMALAICFLFVNVGYVQAEDSIAIVAPIGDGYTESVGWVDSGLKYETATTGRYMNGIGAWCRYDKNIDKSGWYKVELYVVGSHATSYSPEDVRVEVLSGDSVLKEENMNFRSITTDEWITLGEFPAEEGSALGVKQTKVSGEVTSCLRAGAMRLTYVRELDTKIIASMDDGYSESSGWEDSGLKYETATIGRYTNAREAWCRFDKKIDTSGWYKVELYIIGNNSASDSCEQVEVAVLNQNDKCLQKQVMNFYEYKESGWVTLGSFCMEQGTMLGVKQTALDSGRCLRAGAMRTTFIKEPDSAVVTSGDIGYTESDYWSDSSMKYETSAQGRCAAGIGTWCQYESEIKTSGKYRVEVFVLPTHTESKSASKIDVSVLKNGSEKSKKEVNFYTEAGWVALGEFNFKENDIAGVRQTTLSDGYNRAGAMRVTHIDEMTAEAHFIPAQMFSAADNWSFVDDYLQYKTNTQVTTGTPTAEFTVVDGGTYRVWSIARDFATEDPGTRTYKAKIDNITLNETFGDHKEEGFRWEDGGTVTLTEGVHTISLVSPKSYARTQGFFLTSDLNYVPDTTNPEEMEKNFPVKSLTARYPRADFPGYANEELSDTTVTTLENEKYKINFIRGTNRLGETSVQNEIFIKNNGALVQIKDKNEDFGFLMMSADKTSHVRDCTDVGMIFEQTLTIDGVSYAVNTTDFLKSGYPYWFIPNSVQKISENEVKLSFASQGNTELSATFSFDDLCSDPKIKLDAKFNKDGAYSFQFFVGKGIYKENMTTVTAPLLFTRNYVPQKPAMWSEVFLTTPMVTYTVNNKAQNDLVTYGLAVDPSCIPQDIAYDSTSRFSFSLRDGQGNLCAQLQAPMFGNEKANFKAGDTYSFAVRLLGGVNDWYDTYKSVAADLYKVGDVRSNYYSSINNAVYNATDLILDDKFGGWDDKAMGYYYSEIKGDEGHTGYLGEAQRYLLSEDQTLLEERVVPTIAFLLSRTSHHFTKNTGNTNVDLNHTLTTTPVLGSGADYLALYKMSQGRMPYLKEFAQADERINAQTAAATYDLTKKPTDLGKVREAADKTITDTIGNAEYMNTITQKGFVLEDYTPCIESLLLGYELLGEQKYLDAAEKLGRMLLTSVSTKGYHNGFATNTYHIDPETTANMHTAYADNEPWFWHGDTQWRLGYPEGQSGPLAGYAPAVDLITEEDVPGWLPATVGLSTEHAFTPGHSNYILMNTWASQLMRLSVYTGDEFFKTQARNATIGRFSNYPGYYLERYWTDYMKADYPYQGPEYNINFYTHTPSFIASLEDYLMTEAWARSEGKISFPYMTSNGYAYFSTRYYGHEPGSMYDEDGLWLWNERGILQDTNDVNLDYVAARKDNVLALALLNEANEQKTFTVALGDKIPDYTGNAKTYMANGEVGSVTVNQNVFEVTIPAKGIYTVVIPIRGLTIPGFVTDEFVHYSENTEQTKSTHINGSGYVIQMDNTAYYAYIYITDTDIRSLTVNYTVDGVSKSETIKEYPFETIIKVDDVTKPLTYTLSVKKSIFSLGESYGGGTLQPVSMTTGTKVMVNDTKVVVATGTAKAKGATVAETDAIGNAIERPTVTDALYAAGITPQESGRPVVYLNNKAVVYPDITYINSNDVITADYKTDGFQPICFGEKGTIISVMGPIDAPLTTGSYKFASRDYSALQAVIPNVDITDAMKGMHINGVLTAAEGVLGAPSGTAWNGYILFDNMPIVQSALNGTRLDYAMDGIEFVNEAYPEKTLCYDKSGNVLGLNPNKITTNLANIYNTNQLYLTDKYTDGKVNIINNGTHYMITTDGTRDVQIIVSTYNNDGKCEKIDVEKRVLTFAEPYVVQLKPNQKLFVWENTNYEQASFIPLVQEVGKK